MIDPRLISPRKYGAPSVAQNHEGSFCRAWISRQEKPSSTATPRNPDAKDGAMGNFAAPESMSRLGRLRGLRYIVPHALGQGTQGHQQIAYHRSNDLSFPIHSLPRRRANDYNGFAAQWLLISSYLQVKICKAGENANFTFPYI
jgi:hypothetical protein